MTVPYPPWKQKTRPCPFYSQGRCLFADSCNFLHDVKVKVRPEDITTSVGIVPGITLTQSPTESDGSVSSPSNSIRRVRSPPRSPRMSSLLLALGDVIESDEDEVEDLVEDTAPSFEVARAFIAASGIFGQVSQRRTTSSVQHKQSSEVTDPVEGPPHAAAEEVSESMLEPAATGSSIIRDSLENLARRFSESGELLSPIEITLAAPAFWPLGQLESIQREDSVDSGFAEWVGPTPLVRSPPRSPLSKRLSTLDLLSSPFGTPARVLSPKFVPSQGSAWPMSPGSSLHPVNSYHVSEEEDVFGELDSPSAYAANRLQSKQSERDSQSTIRILDVPLIHGEMSHTEPDTIQPEDDHGERETTLTGHPPSPSTIGSSSSVTMSRSISIREREGDDDILLEDDSVLAYMTSLEAADTPVFDVPVRNELVHDESPSVKLTFTPPSLSPKNMPGHSTTTTSMSFSRRGSQSAPDGESIPHPSSTSSGHNAASTPSHGQNTRSLPRKSLSFNTVSSPNVLRNPTSRTSDNVADSPIMSRPVSPNMSLRSPFQSSSPASPSVSTRQSSISDMASERKSRASHKVPFGFRHSTSTPARSRDSSVSSRHTTTSRSSNRHRPPALMNLRTSFLNESAELLTPSEPSSTFSKLKPLRLSLLLNASGSALSSSGITPSLTTSTSAASHSSSPSVSSGYSISHNALLSSPRSSLIPDRKRNTLIIHQQQSATDELYQSGPFSAPLSNRFTWRKDTLASARSPLHDVALNGRHPNSRFSEPVTPLDEDLGEGVIAEEDEDEDEQRGGEEDESGGSDADVDATIRIAEFVHVAAVSRPQSSASIFRHEPMHTIASRPQSVASVFHESVHAIATPSPTLIFAIASDDVNEVQRVLESGEAGPNDDVGPQSALAFAATSEQLKNKVEIVKMLLAYGADPSSLRESGRNSRTSIRSSDTDPSKTSASDGILAGVDAATRYYIGRAEAPQMRRASALIHRSFFRPLTKVRYDMVGQDRALEQLFRVLSMLTTAPIVVLLCGPSGHGKSLLARKFGHLLDVPTHTVNMTTLRSTHDIWRSYSMNPYEPPSTSTLSDFLIENEGKRSVVVLDEIEKTENEKVLSSLLMPWELGRCSFEAGHRHVDVSKVIWLGTSNVGHDLVFEHQASRTNAEEPMTREEYLDLIGLLRPKVSDRLGPSVLSRVTTVLPFIPFTVEEQTAIATEALHALAGDASQSLPSATVDKLIENALRSYIPAEGARSLYRAVSNELLDTL